MLGIVVAGALGDLRESQVRGGEQTLCFLLPATDDLFVGRAAEALLKASFQQRARHRHGEEHVRNANAVAGVFPDELRGSHQRWIIERHDVRGVTQGDADRRNVEDAGCQAATAQLPASVTSAG